MGQHLLGFTAQQQSFNAFAAVRGHHDQVSLVFFGSGNDGIRDHIRFDSDGFGVDAFGLGVLFDRGQLNPGRFGPLGFDAGDFFAG